MTKTLTPGPSPIRTPGPPGEGGALRPALFPFVSASSLLPIRLRGGATDGEAARAVTLPSPGGPGVRPGEGLGVRAGTHRESKL